MDKISKIAAKIAALKASSRTNGPSPEDSEELKQIVEDAQDATNKVLSSIDLSSQGNEIVCKIIKKIMTANTYL